jgi:uncharacterized membrane protein
MSGAPDGPLLKRDWVRKKVLFPFPVVMPSLVMHEAGGVNRVVSGPIRGAVVVGIVEDIFVVVCARVNIAQRREPARLPFSCFIST